MKNKMKMRMISILLCFVMLVGLMPTSVFAAGTKLETPQNLKLQGTVLSWDAVGNADFYGITLYHPNYVYSIGSWQTDGTSINLYKYLKDGETYGATVIACSNGSYQISNPAEIPLTACTNAGVPIYRDVNVVNGTSSDSTAYPGMSVRLEAKPAPDGMVFDRWELSGGYINIGYSDTDTVIYVQAICDNDISARATYKYQENVTSAFTVQPQGGAALVGEYFDVTYAMNFTPQGTVKVQVEGNTPGDFTDLKQGEIDSASIKEDSVVTKTFRIMAYDGTRNIYSDEFVVSWEDGPRFISQPVGGTVDHNVNFVATYALNFTPFSCRIERYSDYLYQWVDLSNASATEATINSYDFNTSSNYRIKAIIEGGGEVYSDEFTVTWSDAVSKFIQQPVGGTVGFDEEFTFTFAINFTPASNIAIQKYNSGFDSWDTVGYCASLTSGTISGFASETTNKYRLEAYENGTPIHSNEFTVTWEGTDYTVSFAANGGSGTMADVNNVSGEYTLPACGFTAPNGKQFKAWSVGGVEKAAGTTITVNANTTVTAIWENIPIAPTQITTQPKTLKIKAGTTAKFIVTATGTSLTYQWQSSADGTVWKNCSSSSATSTTFTFTSKTSHNSNYYRCKITDAKGKTVYTDAVRLYVLGITTQPKTLKIKAGTTAKYTVKATGTGLTYQWQSSTNGKTWKNCSSSSATKATFTFTSKTSHNSNYYRCMVKDNGGNTIYTDAIRLYVLGVVTQPKTLKIKAGTTAKYTVKATGAGLTYQWQSSTNGKTWKNCSSSSATKATFTFTSKTSHSSNYYRCIVKDNGGNTIYTDAVRLYVLGITEQPTSKTVTKGKTAKFTVEATGASKTYQWQVSTDGGKTWKNCSSASAKKATFSFTAKTSHNGNYYRCRIKDSSGNTVYTNKVKLTVK